MLCAVVPSAAHATPNTSSLRLALFLEAVAPSSCRRQSGGAAKGDKEFVSFCFLGLLGRAHTGIERRLVFW